MKKVKKKKSLNNELRHDIIGLCYIDICHFIWRKANQYEVTERKISYPNGLTICYAYKPSSYQNELREDMATIDCQLLHDGKIVVLFFRSFINEGPKSLWSLRKEFDYMEDTFSIKQAEILLQLLAQGHVKNTTYYDTAFHAAPWMKEYLADKFQKEKTMLTQEIDMSGYSQEEIDNPENKRLKIEYKEEIREELALVLDEFKAELISRMMQAREELSLVEENMDLVDLYIAKLGESLSYHSIKKEGKQKKLK